MLATDLGLERTTYVKYENNGIQPPNDMVVKLAKYFDVTTDYLLGNSNDRMPLEKEKSSPQYSDEDLEAAMIISSLPEEDKQYVLGLLERLENKPKK